MKICKYLLGLALLLAKMSFAMDQSILPEEIWMRIARFSGPNGREKLWRTDRWFRNIINQMQKPLEEGGMGLIDTLPWTSFIAIFRGEQLYSVTTSNQRYFINKDHRPRDLWQEDKDEKLRHIPLTGDLVHLCANEGNIYIATTARTVHVIDGNSGELKDTFHLSFKIGFFISAAPHIVYIIPFQTLKVQGLFVIDYTAKKLFHVPVGHDAMPFAKYRNHIIGRHNNLSIPTKPNTWSSVPRGMFIVDGSTHEIILEVEGTFEYPWLSLGNTVRYRDPSGHLPEDNS